MNLRELRRQLQHPPTLIDLILTNKPEYISTGGVLHLGISDHSLVYAVRKLELPKSRPTIKEVRDFKHFSESQFRADLLQVDPGIQFATMILIHAGLYGNQFFTKF